ncbi:YlmH/Sll1252 family protein [Blautia schinkii]|nr:YlmH/Sll1252 family protein [Blautia schinkii]
MEKEEFFLKRIRELANISYHRDIVTFSDFLNLNEQNIVSSQDFRSLGVTVESFGGYENAERQMVAFHPDALAFPWEYPIDCLRVEPKALKFSEELGHRDYLGAILNLGVDRSVVGDILVQENAAWFFCLQKMTDFFLENLCRVRHTNILITKVEDPGELPSPNLTTVSGTCSSVRLDALIALAFRESRSSMVSYIEGGQVFVNGRIVTSNGYEPKEGDIISVRGKGRFLYEGVSRQTKKGRLSVRISRYV